MNKPKTVILGLTRGMLKDGVREIINDLKKKRFSVTAVLPEGTRKSIKPGFLKRVTGNNVYRGLFDEPQGWDVEHISLAQKADLVLIAPADRSIVDKIACGICDDLLTCVVCATKAKVLFLGRQNNAAAGNVKKLKSLGYRFISSVKDAF